MNKEIVWQKESNGYTTKSENGTVIIVSDKDRIIVPLFCPFCEIIMKTYEDAESFKEFNCCETCKVYFIESDKIAWLSGKRPDQQKFEAYMNNRLSFHSSH